MSNDLLCVDMLTVQFEIVVFFQAKLREVALRIVYELSRCNFARLFALAHLLVDHRM